jgi:hypothetical protein
MLPSILLGIFFMIGYKECVWIFYSRCKWSKFTPTLLRKYSCSAATLRFSRLVGANFVSFSLAN